MHSAVPNVISALPRFVALGFLLVASGCPDPTVGQGAPAAPGAGGPGGGAPGAAGGGTAGQPPPPAGGRPDVRFDVTAGNAVAVSGTITYEGSQTGTVKLDFLSRDADSPPELLHSEVLDALGDWSVQVPKSTGQLYIVAFVDTTDGGPYADDPAGMPEGKVVVAEADVPGVNITLSDDADLGDLEPRAKTDEAGAGQPPPGQPPSGGPEPSTAQQPPSAQAGGKQAPPPPPPQ